jgi:DNA adenine methylase
MKWVGGKDRLMADLGPVFPHPGRWRTFVEPFVGGGAAFYYLRRVRGPEFHAILGDRNRHLIATYQALRDQLGDFLGELGRHPYLREHFEEVKRRLNTELDAPLVARAAWAMAISRYGYNGLWRENAAGGVNVPFGKPSKPNGPPPQLVDEQNLRACAHALAGVDLRVGDFTDTLADVGKGAFVYLDPPYIPVSATAKFTGYSGGKFTHARRAPGQPSEDAGAPASDQERLLACCAELSARGALFVLSNSDTPEARAMYAAAGYWISTVQAARSINCDPKKRGPVSELVVRNFS